MASIGLNNLYYAPITVDSETGEETYGTPVKLAEAISANLSVNIAAATLYADDGASESAREFSSGTISLNVADLGKAKAAALLGGYVDENGVLVSSSEDTPSYVALGFAAKRSSGHYEHYWLYKVQFSEPSINKETKGEGITFQTPTLEGTVMRRTKADATGRHPWKASVVGGESGVSEAVITAWFNAVYEPSVQTPGQST